MKAGFFERLRELGVKLTVDGDALRVSAPKGAVTAELRAEIGARKAEIMKVLRAADAATPLKALGQAAPADSRGSPLSFGQQRLWFLDQLAQGNAIYSIPGAVRMYGALDVDALRRALDAIVLRHEILRTTFAENDGEVRQVVQAAAPMFLSERPTTSPNEPEDELKAIIERESSAPFDLESGPLLRATLVKVREDEHVLVVNVHHIVADGWSFAILIRELGAFYEAFVAGVEPSLPPLALQYRDFVSWQREALRGEALRKQIDYWRKQLAGRLPVLDLPFARARPTVQSYRAAREFETFDSHLLDELKVLARREGSTLFMVLLAAFKILLYRYTGESDVTVGTPIANRRRTELEPMIGFFLNSLALRSNLADDQSFRDVLAQVRNTTLDAYANQDAPFEEVVAALNPPRSASHAPVFQAMFVLQNLPIEALRLRGLRLEMLELDSPVSEYDLNAQLMEVPGGLAVGIQYSLDLFDAATIRDVLGHYRTLLEGIAADSDALISRLPLVDAAERARLLADSQGAAINYRAACIHTLFEEQAARAPQQLAVEFGRERVTYAELDRRAAALASRLTEIGVRRDLPIGVMLPRSPEMLVTMLGILKAGAAYLPLDPKYPLQRRAFMLEDSGATIVVSDAAHAGELAGVFAGAVVRVEEVPRDLRRAPELDAADPGTLAYVIYTSGSTGRPKGVEIEHRAVANFLESMRAHPGIDRQDRVLAITTIAFDISVLELFLPLTVGGTVVLASDEAGGDPLRLATEIAATGATVLQATPATWRLLIESGWNGDGRIKALCGGEALPSELAEQLLERCGSVWNLYGPTETTVWSAVHRLEKGQGVPIGRPIANTQFHVLDTGGQPVPIGIPGELWIGGAGVARGYHARPDLDAERFATSPLPSATRMYRTGDRVRRRRDGLLDFQGRLDFQVKLNGFRIELGEVESALRRHAAVRDVVVVAREDAAGERRLVAYWIAAAVLAEVADLRAFLGETLPYYMVPSAFVQLDAFPLTNNGKIDRKALPAPAYARLNADASFTPPASDLERRIAEIWAQLMNVERVGANDNFFDLGGTSLLLVQVQRAVRRQLGREVSLVDFFRHPTVASLAERLARSELSPAPLRGIESRTARQKSALAAVEASAADAAARRRGDA